MSTPQPPKVELADLSPLLLKKERATASFDVPLLIDVIHGSRDQQARRKHLLHLVINDPVLCDRDMISRNHKERYEKALEKSHAYAKLLETHHITDPDEQTYVYYAIGEPLPIDVHRSMFIPTLQNQMDDEQQAIWVPKATSFQITGAYAQTELGHGSNVQGIETTAHYDKNTQEFVLNSPTLTSRKWWPGGLGKTANHCVLHARLLLDGKDRGVQAFLVPLRDTRTHETLPGITLGDIGPKIGFQSVDNGFCVLDHVRIPRRNMLMRFAKVAPDGSFSKPPMDKLVYFTMVKIRVLVAVVCARSMASAITIATRFSAARIQGSTGRGQPENQVLDYENQQLTLFPLIGLAYASYFAHRGLDGLYQQVASQVQQGEMGLDQLFLLNQLHASASGLKALLTEEVGNGIERARRACGGHGYSATSNLPYIFQEFIGACTYEGTKDVLVQQHGAFLLKCLHNRRAPPTTSTPGLNLLEFLHVDAHSKCAASHPSDVRRPDVLLRAFQVRALELLVRADAHSQSLHHLTQASVAHAEWVVLSCFYAGVKDIKDGNLKLAMLQLWQLYGLWRLQANLGEFRLADHLSSTQGTWVQDQLLALLPLVRRNAVALVDGFGLSDFELNSTIGRYDGDIYRALVARAAAEPLNQTDVVPGYHQWLQPLLSAKL